MKFTADMASPFIGWVPLWNPAYLCVHELQTYHVLQTLPFMGKMKLISNEDNR